MKNRTNLKLTEDSPVRTFLAAFEYNFSEIAQKTIARAEDGDICLFAIHRITRGVILSLCKFESVYCVHLARARQAFPNLIFERLAILPAPLQLY